MHPSLPAVASDEFLDRYVGGPTVQALISVLRRAPEVAALRAAIVQDAVTDNELELFIRDLLRQFVPGEYFRYDVTIAAIVVALRAPRSAYTQKMLSDLGGLEIHEIQYADKVAALLLSEQREKSCTMIKVFGGAIPDIAAAGSVLVGETSDSLRVERNLHRSTSQASLYAFAS